jgi:hypothetical protein
MSDLSRSYHPLSQTESPTEGVSTRGRFDKLNLPRKKRGCLLTLEQFVKRVQVLAGVFKLPLQSCDPCLIYLVIGLHLW